MCNVRSCVADISVHLAHDADVFVAVEQGVLGVLFAVWAVPAAGVRCLVGLQARIGQDDD